MTAAPAGRRLAGVGLIAALLFAGFVALGLWQVQRLGWKRALIAQVEGRIHAAPVAGPVQASAADAYRRVVATGSFLHDRATLVRATTARGSGYWLMTPLATDRGFTLLVNRGFLPAGETTHYSRPQGAVRVTGLLRVTEPGGDMLRANRPAEGQWYSRDVAAIATARRLPGPVAPYFVDAQAVPGAPAPPFAGMTVVRFPNNHLGYAITWFALAALTLAAYSIVMIEHRKAARA